MTISGTEKGETTLSARIRALLGVPTATAINFTPAESNLDFESFRVEASSQLQNCRERKQMHKLH